MSIDYNGIGGIGIEFTEDMATDIINLNGLFTEEEWDDDEDECMERIGLDYEQAGSAYSGETRWYLLVDGENLPGVIANADKFIKRLTELSVDVTMRLFLITW